MLHGAGIELGHNGLRTAIRLKIAHENGLFKGPHNDLDEIRCMSKLQNHGQLLSLLYKN